MTEEISTETRYDENGQPIPYVGEVPFGYEIYYITRETSEGIQEIPQLKKIDWTPEERIYNRIIYLKNKAIDGVITENEKEELKLLVLK